MKPVPIIFFTEKMGLTGVLGFSPRVDSCDETVMTMIPPPPSFSSNEISILEQIWIYAALVLFWAKFKWHLIGAFGVCFGIPRD